MRLERGDINAFVMDLEGAEVGVLQNARLPGDRTFFFELHDYLYGLARVRAISAPIAYKGLIYDPLGSGGSCVLYSCDDGERQFDALSAAASRARTRSRTASWTTSGTHTPVSSPARCSRASVTASAGSS